jgi:uncharacterized protein YuzE
MKIQYFWDTDTALVEFSDPKVAETKFVLSGLYLEPPSDEILSRVSLNGKAFR